MTDTGRPLRILYVPGPGDVYASFLHWQEGRLDPAIPAIAYSAQVYHLVRWLGARMTVLSHRPLPDDARGADGIDFIHLPPREGRGPAYHLAEIGDVREIIRLCRDRGIDAVILQRKLIHYWPLRALQAAGIAVIVSLHNSLWPVQRPPTPREALMNQVNRGVFRRAARMICVSEAIRDQVLSVTGSGGVPVTTHIPQYDPALREAWRARPPGRPLREALYLGRIEDNKGVFLLLEAFGRVAAAHPDMRLSYLGRGGDLDRLRAAAAADPFASRIEVAGAVSGAEVIRRLQESDLLVCPTTSHFAEGLAKTPIEAAICGVPSLLTTSVPAGALMGEAARSVAVDDAGALAGALDGMASDPALLDRMAAATRGRVAPVFDPARSLAAELAAGLRAAFPARVPEGLPPVT